MWRARTSFSAEDAALPLARSCHTVTLVPADHDEEVALIYGGYLSRDHHMSVNAYKHSSLIVPPGSSPPASSTLGSSTVCPSSPASTQCTPGNTVASPAQRTKESNELFMFEFNVNGDSNGRWSKPKAKGDSPGFRYCHTADYFNGHLVLFGGFDGNTRHNEVFTLDLATFTWARVNTLGPEPEHLSHHTTSVFGNYLIVFGGLNDSGKIRNDLYLLDMTSMTWNKPEVSGARPGPRLSCASAVYGNKFWIFGGYDGKTRMNDVHCLELSTMRWSKPAISGQPPCQRYSHSMTKDRNFLLIFGGDDGCVNQLDDLHILDLDSLRWMPVPKTESGLWPEPRKNHAAAIHKGFMYLFGGSGRMLQSPLISDTFCLSLRAIPEMRTLSFDEASDMIHRDLLALALSQHQQTESSTQPTEPPSTDESSTRKRTPSAPGAPPNTDAAQALANLTSSAATLPIPEVRQKIETIINVLRTQLVQLHTHMDRLKADRQQFEEMVQEERKHQETVMEQAASTISNNRRMITLNVGGIRYDTSIYTLTKEKNSMLAAMFGGRYELSVSPDGSVFLDRDGTHFRYILNYLRDGHVNLPLDHLFLNQLLREAEFFQLEGLKALINKKLRKAKIRRFDGPP